MPGNFLEKNIDLSKERGDKLGAMEQYIYQLVEQLRYTLSHLSSENFNPSSLDTIFDKFEAELKESFSDNTGEELVIRRGENSIEIRQDGVYLAGKVYINGTLAGGEGT